ncbi:MULTISPECIES: YraN family protein [Enterobacterales]|uniref:YraN family protein n=1 Tax=Enterobacterales TaxID=91347 RepID=UPI00084811A8|nr:MULTISPECIES: YraN family protein [Enterobacterales]WOO50394.1 YraN family protein [Hafnia alvei]MCK9782501.1 YraN family protein [Proteus columbae]MCT6517760.1 YraN family protein [Proteus vulgaris]ODQ06252.1 YraN family protein [Shigella sp. FC130]OEI93765.1 YraN family protein [Shigella sp. FC1655]
MIFSKNPYFLGRYYEQKALKYLRQQGLILIERNVRYPCGEIDLIMQEKRTWVFVEVRFRRNILFGDAISSVTTSKRRRLWRTAKCWLAQHQESIETSDCRFDICAFDQRQLIWLKNILDYTEFIR